MFAAGLAKTSWPGQLPFHTFPNGENVLVDGAHNQGSAQTPAEFIATLFPGLSNTHNPSDLTYLLGLPHPPFKQPLDTLAPLFSPPGDMPSVKAQPPWTIYDAVKAHCPHARLWAPSEFI